MTKSKAKPNLKIHIPLLSAKSWDEYLSDANGDATEAGKKARQDVASRETQNVSARRFQRVYGKVISELGLTEDISDEDAATEAALKAIKNIKGASDESKKKLDSVAKTLKDLGIDIYNLDDGVKVIKEKIELAKEAETLKKDNVLSKAAAALGFDATKLAKVLRDEVSLPELKKIKVKGDDGNEVEKEVWGLQKDNVFTPLTEHTDVKGFEAALKLPVNDDAGTGMPIIIPGKASASVSGATLKLDEGFATGSL